MSFFVLLHLGLKRCWHCNVSMSGTRPEFGHSVLCDRFPKADNRIEQA